MRPERMIFGQRLFAKDVQSGLRDFAGIKRMEQSIIINQRTATGIDNTDPRFHFREPGRIQNILCRLGKRQEQYQYFSPGNGI